MDRSDLSGQSYAATTHASHFCTDTLVTRTRSKEQKTSVFWTEFGLKMRKDDAGTLVFQYEK